MNRLPALDAKNVAKALERAGFCFVRQKGSHQIYVKDSMGIVLPWHNKELKKGTIRHIIKQSGLTKKEFLELLKK